MLGCLLSASGGRERLRPESCAASGCLPKGHAIAVFIGHALHEKGLQRKTGDDGTPFSSQERRALAVPMINRSETAVKSVVNRWFRSPIGLHRISFVRASEASSRTVSSIRWRAKVMVFSWPDRLEGVPFYLASSPLAAPSCAAPNRPARSVSGFWIRQVFRMIGVYFGIIINFIIAGVWVLLLIARFGF